MKQINESYVSNPQQRLLAVVKTLSGHEVRGLTIAQISEAINSDQATVLRCITNLIKANFVESIPNSSTHYRLGKLFVNISNTAAATLSQEQNRIAQDIHNFSRCA